MVGLKTEQYKTYIKNILEKYDSYLDKNDPVRNLNIFDDEKGHYCAMDVGWNGTHFVHNCIFHFDVIDGKIWLQANWTDWDVTKDLVEMGVPKSDIVLGFLSPDRRAFDGFAKG